MKPARRIRLKGATKFRSRLAVFLGAVIAKQRVNRGLNQRTAADLCEIPLARYVKIEEGTASTVNVSTLGRIAERLQFDWDTAFSRGEWG